MIRVMIVDDSGVYRMLLSKALRDYDDIEVVGTASDGHEAIEKMAEFQPDIITLDMNMPRMNGMETLAVLAVKYPSVQVIVVASETRNDAERAVMILEAGAFEMVIKPKATNASPMDSLRQELYPIIKAAANRKVGISTPKALQKKKEKIVLATNTMAGFVPDIVAIGSSTGGPAALHDVLGKISSDFPIPIIVVQHMPKLFIESLAVRLNRDLPLSCQVAEENTTLKPGVIYFAPGDVHSEVVKSSSGQLAIQFSHGAPEHHCKPAADVTLRSLAKLAPQVKTLVVILTGMGKDGALGAQLLSQKGAKVTVQDEESSVVWGMPGETVKLGAANQVLPVKEIGVDISRSVPRYPQ